MSQAQKIKLADRGTILQKMLQSKATFLSKRKKDFRHKLGEQL